MQRQRRHDRPSTGPTRRQVLATLGAMAGGAAAGAGALDWLAAGTPPAFAQKKTFAIRFGTTLSASSPQRHRRQVLYRRGEQAGGRRPPGPALHRRARSAPPGTSWKGCSSAPCRWPRCRPRTSRRSWPTRWCSTSRTSSPASPPSSSSSTAPSARRSWPSSASARSVCAGSAGTTPAPARSTTAGRPINSPDDLKGMKIRVEENPVRVASLNAMGAQATPMAFTEVYGALQQKVVDGAENSEQTYMTNKHYRGRAVPVDHRPLHDAEHHRHLHELSSPGCRRSCRTCSSRSARTPARLRAEALERGRGQGHGRPEGGRRQGQRRRQEGVQGHRRQGPARTMRTRCRRTGGTR